MKTEAEKKRVLVPVPEVVGGRPQTHDSQILTVSQDADTSFFKKNRNHLVQKAENFIPRNSVKPLGPLNHMCPEVPPLCRSSAVQQPRSKLSRIPHPGPQPRLSWGLCGGCCRLRSSRFRRGLREEALDVTHLSHI